ncbi:MAG: hypothetical protein ACMXYK_04365 [Candidatus Woesearchaeota archaeon]
MKLEYQIIGQEALKIQQVLSTDSSSKSSTMTRICADCQKDNELVGINDAQLVFPFYNKLISEELQTHGICNACLQKYESYSNDYN